MLFLGKIIAYAGMLEGKEVTWFPSYGAEVRGGTANCTIIVSDELIGSPVVANPDILIVMSDASLNRFLPRLERKGLLLFDSSLIKERVTRADICIVGVPATEIARKIGDTKSANMVLLGVLIAETQILKDDLVLQAVNSLMPDRKKRLAENNKKAIKEGIRYIEDKKSPNR
ncbi:MAG: 2-oxoacid:acceptor oxidoreductase family protein [Nitrospirota bacterium]